MGGFKEGSVSGWDTDEEASDEEVAHNKSNDAIPSADGVQTEGTADSSSAERTPRDVPAEKHFETADIPWILRRSSITDGREQTVQLHLQESTLELQREQKTEIEAQLGESVRKADLREAALLVGLQQSDDVIDVLREWGYALE